MKIFVATIFVCLAVSAFAEENWKIDWPSVIPRTEVPGYLALNFIPSSKLNNFFRLRFWDNRLIKPSFVPSNQRHGRIVGGAVVTPNSHPYQAGLLQRILIFQTLCGGSLLTSRSVLTAAHCPENTQSTDVILGAHVLTANEPTQQRQNVPSSAYRLHPQYNTQTLENDVAILILPSTVTLNAFIQPTRLPSGAELSNLFVGELGTVTGWGVISDSSGATSTHLRSAQNNVVTNALCAVTFGQFVFPSTICLSASGGVGSCNGDSGGPLTLISGGQRVQIGIVSNLLSQVKRDNSNYSCRCHGDMLVAVKMVILRDTLA